MKWNWDEIEKQEQKSTPSTLHQFNSKELVGKQLTALKLSIIRMSPKWPYSTLKYHQNYPQGATSDI